MAKEKVGSQKAARRKQRKKKGGITAKRKKEFTFRGYTMEELLEMPFDEMVLLLPSRANRRDVPIVPQFVGKRVSVYNGKEFIEFEIKPEMIGHFTGEFAMTRGEVKHSGPGVGATRGSKFLPLK